jgi:hypothetical protein|tara:strand:+ start:1687 stop:2919 length:1233 start_codon:yes stop_codon:yes gene_type:complete
MEEQKRLKLEVAVILDKEILNYDILGNTNFKIKVVEPFNNLSIDLMTDFSDELRKTEKINQFPDLVYLTFWCRKNTNKDLVKHFNNNYLRLGRGLIFHICPSNVPTNFIYSFFFGLLSGNSNIVKIPSKNFKEKDIILSVLKSLFNKKKYLSLKNANCFIQYNNKDQITQKISSICDGRVIWGGNKTINDIRKTWIPERAIDITFPDRYSLSVINLNKLKKAKSDQIKLLAKKFYYDGYMMNQLACNSPHFVFWVGKKNKELQNYFWNQLNKTVEKKFFFDDIHIVDKYTNLIENIIIQKDFKNIKMLKNNLYVVDPDNKTNNIEDIRGVNGTFFQKNINQINNLKQFITKKCQTVSYFGFTKAQLKYFLLNNNLLGIDRVVPIGKASEIDIIWDGHDIVKSLSRVISVE